MTMPRYLEFKLSWQFFSKAPEALSPHEAVRLERIAASQAGIERRILASAEAAAVAVPASLLEARLLEIRGRYPDPEDYRRDLERLGLDDAGLAAAVNRDLHVEAVLERVAASVPACDETEAEIFYRLHPQSFCRPEARRLRHILLTFGNRHERRSAVQRLERLRPDLDGIESFARAALRHSQCPTALQGGELGVVKRGDLYAELEPAAFALAEGELSQVLESPMGLHLIRCDRIFPAGTMEFVQVRDRIAGKLTDQRRQQAQRAWIAALPA